MSDAARAGDCESEWAFGIEARSPALLSEGEDADSRYRKAIDRLGRTRVRVELVRSHQLYGDGYAASAAVERHVSSYGRPTGCWTRWA